LIGSLVVKPASTGPGRQHRLRTKEGTAMPLSKNEQRTLDEIERALREEDPKFAANVSFDRLWRHRVVVGGSAFLLGMVVMLAGEVATQTLVAVGVVVSLAGFLTMLAAAGWMFRGRSRT